MWNTLNLSGVEYISSPQPSTSAVSVPTPTSNVEDLFSAHDFDIQIDLPTGPEGTHACLYCSALCAAMCMLTDNIPRRCVHIIILCTDFYQRTMSLIVLLYFLLFIGCPSIASIS